MNQVVLHRNARHLRVGKKKMLGNSTLLVVSLTTSCRRIVGKTTSPNAISSIIPIVKVGSRLIDVIVLNEYVVDIVLI